MRPGTYLRKKKSLAELFWAKVSKNETGCWGWTACKTVCGYGHIHFRGKTLIASRVSYELNVGPIGNSHVLHRCDNPECTRPDHLFLGDQNDNMQDKSRKNRAPWGEDTPTAKLTSSQIAEIIKMCESGKRGIQTRVAEQFGVTQSHVSRICSGHVWNRIEGVPNVVRGLASHT